MRNAATESLIGRLVQQLADSNTLQDEAHAHSLLTDARTCMQGRVDNRPCDCFPCRFYTKWHGIER